MTFHHSNVLVLLSCFSFPMCPAVKRKIGHNLLLEVYDNISHRSNKSLAYRCNTSLAHKKVKKPYLISRIDPELLSSLIDALRAAYNDAKHPFIQSKSDIELLEDLIEEFENLDIDNDGYIGQEEFRRKYVAQLTAADRDRNGEVDFVEFATSKAMRKAEAYTSSEMDRDELKFRMTEFKTLDRDNDGHISQAELRQARLNLSGGADQESVFNEMIGTDLNGDDEIDFAEFVRSKAETPPDSKQPVVIDTDMGIDDLATIIASAVHRVPIAAVTTTAGLCPPGGHIFARRLLDRLELPTVPVVAGCEVPPQDRCIPDWESDYADQLDEAKAQLGLTKAKDEIDVVGSAQMVADDIIRVGARHKVDVLAIGSLINLAEMATTHADKLKDCVRRIIITASAEGQPYNVDVDPAAMRTLLRAAKKANVPIVLIGEKCYADPSWVECMFDWCTIPGKASLHRRMFAQLGCLDPENMSYDTLTLFYWLHPEAFVTPAPVAIRVTTGDAWCVDICSEEESDGIVVVPELVGAGKDKYERFLRETSGL